MGQLEKYGLYVLCLVIFLILGVTIWGGGDLQASPKRGPSSSPSNLMADARGTKSAATPVTGEVTLDLDRLLQPVPPVNPGPKKETQIGGPKLGGEPAVPPVGPNGDKVKEGEKPPPAPEARP